ncbi:unnamed protein product [Schistosoma turkestanicum]|nr:unnamed protein product [Schistosoma turkestanicum]
MGSVLSTFSTDDSPQFPNHHHHTPPKRTLSDIHNNRTKELKHFIPCTPHHRSIYDEYNDQCDDAVNKNWHLNQNDEALTGKQDYDEYITENHCIIESDKTLNPVNMFSLKRFLLSSLSRKPKISSTSNGIIQSMRRLSNDRMHRLSVKSDGKNTLNDCSSDDDHHHRKGIHRSTIEIPIIYYQEQQANLLDSTKLTNDIRRNHNHSILSSSQCDSSHSRGVSQLEPFGMTQNSCHFQTRNVMNNSMNRKYHLSDQKSVTDFTSVYQKDFIIHHDTTTTTTSSSGNAQRRQLSEPNSRLKHRYSHCLSTELNRKCCALHHNHKTMGNTIQYTPSLVDLRKVTRTKSSNNKQSTEQLCVSNFSPYSFIKNNSIVQTNNTYFYIPTSTITEKLSQQFTTLHDETVSVQKEDAYPREHHHHHLPQSTQYDYHQNIQFLNDQLCQHINETNSPATRSCSFDIHLPVNNQYCDNHLNQFNSNLPIDTKQEHDTSSTVIPSTYSTHSVNNNNNNNIQYMNSSCVHNCLSQQQFTIPNQNTQYNHNYYPQEPNPIDESLSSQFDRRLTEFHMDPINPSSSSPPIHHTQRKMNNNLIGLEKCRNITKSISCYALKLFTHHHHHHTTNNNNCQQKYKIRSSGESAPLTKSFFRTNNIISEQKIAKLRLDKKFKKNSTDRRDIDNENSTMSSMMINTTSSMTTTETMKPTNEINNNQKHAFHLQHSRTNNTQSTECIQCLNNRKTTTKVNGFYGMLGNLKIDHKLDRYRYMKHLSQDDQYQYYDDETSTVLQTNWRRSDLVPDQQYQSGSGKLINHTTCSTTTTTTTTTATTPHGYNLFRQPIFKASTSELLKCLSIFIVARIQMNLLENANHLHHSDLHGIQPTIIVTWIRAIDRALLLQGWSEVAFINPTHIVFLYMMLKTFIQNDNIQSERELHTLIMACLYLAYSYIGNEISYPLRPFLIAETNQLIAHSNVTSKKLFLSNTSSHSVTTSTTTTITSVEQCLKSKIIDEVRNRFWQYVIRIVNEKSSEMLRINAEPILFTQMFKELTSYDNIVIAMKLFANHNHHQHTNDNTHIHDNHNNNQSG